MPHMQQRPVDVLNMDKQSTFIISSMAAATKCVNRLVREGFTVLSVHAGNRNPRVVIQSSARCERLEGAVAIRKQSREGRTSIMAAEFEGCQVEWTVRGN